MSAPKKFNLAYNLAKFFIENSRITILLLIFFSASQFRQLVSPAYYWFS
jgi:hypothetical protein